MIQKLEKNNEGTEEITTDVIGYNNKHGVWDAT